MSARDDSVESRERFFLIFSCGVEQKSKRKSFTPFFMRKPLIDGNLKRWNNKKEKYLVFYIITRWKLGNSYTNWNVFLVFSRIWLAIVRSPDRCETAPNRTFLNASSVGFGRIELYYTFRGWRYDRAELDGRRRIIDNIFRVLIYVIFVFKNALL